MGDGESSAERRLPGILVSKVDGLLKVCIRQALGRHSLGGIASDVRAVGSLCSQGRIGTRLLGSLSGFDRDGGTEPFRAGFKVFIARFILLPVPTAVAVLSGLPGAAATAVHAHLRSASASPRVPPPAFRHCDCPWGGAGWGKG